MKKYCIECGQLFEIAPTENYKTLCKPCFIDSKKNETESLQNEVIRLRAENYRLKLRLADNSSYRNQPKTIKPDFLKMFKQLCHPDKHQNSQLSTAVFSELNRF